MRLTELIFVACLILSAFTGAALGVLIVYLTRSWIAGTTIGPLLPLLGMWLVVKFAAMIREARSRVRGK